MNKIFLQVDILLWSILIVLSYLKKGKFQAIPSSLDVALYFDLRQVLWKADGTIAWQKRLMKIFCTFTAFSITEIMISPPEKYLYHNRFLYHIQTLFISIVRIPMQLSFYINIIFYFFYFCSTAKKYVFYLLVHLYYYNII